MIEIRVVDDAESLAAAPCLVRAHILVHADRPVEFGDTWCYEHRLDAVAAVA